MYWIVSALTVRFTSPAALSVLLVFCLLRLPVDVLSDDVDILLEFKLRLRLSMHFRSVLLILKQVNFPALFMLTVGGLPFLTNTRSSG
jgi:hypothetical protein